MGNPGHNLGNLFAELKRRKVVRVAVVYGIVAFAVMQAAEIMVPALNLPPQFITFMVAGALLGYPIALVLAWSYDIVPDAVARQAGSAASPEKAADDQREGMRSGYRILVALGILAVAGIAWMQYRSTTFIPAARPPLAYCSLGWGTTLSVSSVPKHR